MAFLANYPGVCCKCNKPINKGDLIHYNRNDKQTWHEECPEPDNSVEAVLSREAPTNVDKPYHMALFDQYMEALQQVRAFSMPGRHGQVAYDFLEKYIQTAMYYRLQIQRAGYDIDWHGGSIGEIHKIGEKPKFQEW